ncbi:MAG: hypothetical protein EOP78_01360 [Variovorax sp.]|nr:MAG: hypothetical protein EOP78_01360 [Variovorax sp.]
MPAPTPPAPPAADRAARDSARAETPAAGARSAIAERESKKLEADDEVPPPASAPKATREAPPPAPAAAPAAAPPAQTAPGPVSPPAADRRSRANAAPAEALSAAPPPAAQGSVGASAAPAAPATAARAPAASTERTDATEPPTFAALSQWNRLAITQSGGATRSVTRAEAGELAPLMGSAAISAVEPRRLAGRVEWRISLERDGKVLAVLELAQGQVRWREGSTPSATGVPPAGALDALRRALGELMAPPTPTPSPSASEPAAEPSR